MNVGEIDLTPPELAAILEHKRVMAEKKSADVSIEEAIEHFILHFRADWLKEKQRRDNEEQRKEIDKHKYFRSMHIGRDIGKAAAAEEWCEKYAHIWRAERESLERNGFLAINVVIQNQNGLHIQPSSTLAVLARKFDCEVYLHREGMDYCNFVLQGKKYLNVKSVLGLLTVAAQRGDALEFIATGAQAQKALEAVAKLINSGFHDLEGVPGLIQE